MTTSILAKLEQFEIQSQSTGRAYNISLKRPEVPVGRSGPLTDCPILILLDSAAVFGAAVENASMRGIFHDVETAVIVGIGYPTAMIEEAKLRVRDLTPSTSLGLGAPSSMEALLGTERGGADLFLSFILDELVPAVVDRVPEASPTRRVLVGASLGGLFTAHALVTRPEAFETFVANSPSLWWNDFEVTKHLDDFKGRLSASGASPRVLITVGSREQDAPDIDFPGVDLKETTPFVQRCRMVDAASDFAKDLKSAGLPEVSSVIFADEDHLSVVPAAIGRAVTFALRKAR